MDLLTRSGHLKVNIIAKNKKKKLSYLLIRVFTPPGGLDGVCCDTVNSDICGTVVRRYVMLIHKAQSSH